MATPALEQLDPDEHKTVYQLNLDRIREEGVHAVQTDAIYAIGRKAS